MPTGRGPTRATVLRLQRTAGNRRVASALASVGRRVVQRQPWLATPQRWIDLNTEIQAQLNLAHANQTRMPANTRRSGWTFLSVIQALLSEAQAQAAGALPAHPAAVAPQAPITAAQLNALVAAHTAAIQARLTAALQFDEGWNARSFLKPLMARVGWAPPPGAAGWGGAIPANPAAATTAQANALLTSCRGHAGLADNDPYINWAHILVRHLAGRMFGSGFTEAGPHGPRSAVKETNGFFPLNWTQATVDANIKLALQTPEVERTLAHAITDGMNWATTTISVGGMTFTIGLERTGAGNWGAATARVYVNQFFPKTLPSIPGDGANSINAWRNANPAGTNVQWFAWLRGTHQQPDN